MLTLLLVAAQAFAGNTNYGCYQAIRKASAAKLEVPFKGSIEVFEGDGVFAIVTSKGVQKCDASKVPIANGNDRKPVRYVGVQLPGHKDVTYLSYGEHITEVTPEDKASIPNVCGKPSQDPKEWAKVIGQRLWLQCQSQEDGGMSGDQQCTSHAVTTNFASCKGLGFVTEQLSQQLASPTEDGGAGLKNVSKKPTPGQPAGSPGVQVED